MAVLALAGVGAAAAVGIGWSAGLTGAALLTAGAVGFSVGNIAGNLLFPQRVPGQQAEGARLGDLTVSSSTYGSIQPFGVGHARMAGNVIWTTDIEETKSTSTSGGTGKGGGKGRGGTVTQTTYTYAGNFAVGLCEGPVDRLIRIWANNKLIYDASSGTDTMQKPGLTFRFYAGDETQLPDSLIEADKGAGNVPAFRGLCYVVFERLPLADFGNRLPNIQVELAFDSTVQMTYSVINGGSPPTIATGYRTTGIAINPIRQRGYVVGITPNTFIEFDLSDMSIISEHLMGDILEDSAWNTAVLVNPTIYIAHDQFLYFAYGTYVYKINPFSWTLKASTITPPNDIEPNGDVNAMTSIAYLGENGLRTILVVRDSLYRSFLYFYDTQSEAFLDTQETSTGSDVFGGGAIALTVGLPGEGVGEAWAVARDTTTPYSPTITINKLKSGQFADVGLLGYSIVDYTGCDLMATFNIADIDASGTGFTGANCIWDESDNSLIIVVTFDGGAETRVLKWSEGIGLIWNTPLTVTGQAVIQISKVAGGTLGMLFSTDVITVNLATGAATTTDYSSMGWGADAQGFQAFSHEANAIVVASGVNDWRKLLVGRSLATVANVGSFITKVMEQIGVDPTDYDTTDVDDIEFDGFLVSQRTPASEVIRPLATIFQIDAVETDYQLVFKKRGGASVVSIAVDDLVRSDSTDAAEPYTEHQVQSIELPRRVSVTYIDINQDFQTNTQAASRVRIPAPTIQTENQVDYQIAASFAADLAKQRAEILLYSAWIERHTFSLILPPEFSYLDPADVVTFTLANGYTLEARLGGISLGVNFATQTVLIAEGDGQYVSTASGALSTGIAVQSIATSAPSQLFLLDVPLLRPQDDLGSSGLRLYWAASPYIETGAWHGAELQTSYDLTSWLPTDITVHAAGWGYLQTALEDGNDTFHTTDQTIVVHVTVGGDDLESVTELQMANGFNAAAVFKENGEIEIIQFLTVTNLGGNDYLLSSLNRGVSGTDTMANDHVAGERIMFITTASVTPIVVPFAYLNRQGYYRPVSAGALAQDAIIESHIYRGRDHMPLAPVLVDATIDGADIDLTWTRRTRVRGGLADGTGVVPIGESVESYEVDIIDTDGETVLRTLTSLAEAVTYAAADITTDFGSIPSTLHVAVYQMSSDVGRGFARVDLLEVA